MCYMIPQKAFFNLIKHSFTLEMYIITDLEGGRYFFNAVKEGDSIIYASDDENECHLWVMAMYRATGQSHKPTPPLTLQDKNSTISKIQGGNNVILVTRLLLHLFSKSSKQIILFKM